MSDGLTTVSSPSGPAKVRVEKLNVAFGRNGNRISVLEDINLNVAAGEFLCIVGPSGCGKTTLIHAMAGFLAPTAGFIQLDGELVSGPDPRQMLVFQERGAFPWLSVEGNIAFGLAHLPRTERRERVAHYVKLVQLEGFQHTYPHELSGGMQQRLQVARALAVKPDTLYLDEPFGALDYMTRLALRAELLRIWEAERKTIVFVTHDIDEALQLGDRVVVLSHRPARIQNILSIDISHPRKMDSARFLELRAELVQQIGARVDL